MASYPVPARAAQAELEVLRSHFLSQAFFCG